MTSLSKGRPTADLKCRAVKILYRIESTPCRPKGMRGSHRTMSQEILRVGVPPVGLGEIAVFLAEAQIFSERFAKLQQERSAAAKELSRPARQRRDKPDPTVKDLIDQNIFPIPQIESVKERKLDRMVRDWIDQGISPHLQIDAVRQEQPELADQLLWRYVNWMFEHMEAPRVRARLNEAQLRLAKEFGIHPDSTKRPNRVLDWATAMVVSAFKYFVGKPCYPLVGQLLRVAELDSIKASVTAPERYRMLGDRARKRMMKRDVGVMYDIWK